MKFWGGNGLAIQEALSEREIDLLFKGIKKCIGLSELAIQ